MAANSDVVTQELGAFFRFLADRGRTSGVLRAMEKHFGEAVTSGDRKKLLAAHKEMKRRVKETFTPSDLEELAAYLPGKPEDDRSKVQAVLQRGHIVSKSEYRLLYDHVEELGSAARNAKVVRQCNKLLAAFHRSKDRAL